MKKTVVVLLSCLLFSAVAPPADAQPETPAKSEATPKAPKDALVEKLAMLVVRLNLAAKRVGMEPSFKIVDILWGVQDHGQAIVVIEGPPGRSAVIFVYDNDVWQTAGQAFVQHG